jgi:hypothetical protein
MRRAGCDRWTGPGSKKFSRDVVRLDLEPEDINKTNEDRVACETVSELLVSVETSLLRQKGLEQPPMRIAPVGCRQEQKELQCLLFTKVA